MHGAAGRWGLRCPFHGWLFNEAGRCLEQPGEPGGVIAHKNLQHTAYPCIERAGIVFAYMGPGEPPPLPAFDCFEAPDEYTFAFKGLWECNWLQALEVGIDPVHASFLHRYLEDEDISTSYGKQFRGQAADADFPLTKVLREFPRPEIQVEETEYGLRLITLRNIEERAMHVRVTNQIFPQAICIPMSNEMTITQWHVPIDDENCFWYAIFTSYGEKVDRELMLKQRLELYELPGYVSRRNKSNNYGFDAREQRTETYTGMGHDINVHDQWAVESQGSIQDHTREHLGKSDIGIIKYRRMLMQALDNVEREEGPLPMLGDGDVSTIRGPVAIDEISSTDHWQKEWKERDLRRRSQSGWAKNPWE